MGGTANEAVETDERTGELHPTVRTKEGLDDLAQHGVRRWSGVHGGIVGV